MCFKIIFLRRRKTNFVATLAPLKRFSCWWYKSICIHAFLSGFEVSAKKCLLGQYGFKVYQLWKRLVTVLTCNQNHKIVWQPYYDGFLTSTSEKSKKPIQNVPSSQTYCPLSVLTRLVCPAKVPRHYIEVRDQVEIWRPHFWPYFLNYMIM